MGKTVPTYRNELERKIKDWKPFRNTLRKRERKAFDEMMELAREKASAATNQASLDPLKSIYISIILGQELKIEKLEKKVEKLEKKVEKLEKTE